ncbi:hypothetical protein F2Q70_00027272 [Brassica cretica]|uniref:Uncharacterized protein n=1 Tax=Brassica cretica TaxID=69181 RepID=A0A8S9LAP5_BRACR|nr:hypothetical protein F2Q70_00027272 [Brassica cretica]
MLFNLLRRAIRYGIRASFWYDYWTELDDYEWKLEFSSSRSDDAELIQLVVSTTAPPTVDVGNTYL